MSARPPTKPDALHEWAFGDWEDREREDNLNANVEPLTDVCGGVFRPSGDNPGILQCDNCGAVAVRLKPKP